MQRAIGMLLEPIYEPIFHDCSYGFRPGRSAHDCVKALREELRKMGDCFVLDIDIRKYFDSIPKAEIRKLVDQRVRDKVVTRMIGKWLNAGVMEKGTVSYSTLGTPQGGVISPILSNIYLHYVLDEWFHETVLKHIRGSARLFRFADDFVIVCKRNDDAKRILEAVGKRLSKYGLNIHPDKSRLVEFRRPSDAGQSGGFNFLGFTFYWGKSRNKRSVVRVKSAKERMARILHRLWELCSKMRHCPIVEQQTRLNRVLRGHYNYYNVSFNQRCVWSVRYWAYGIWRYWLNRRAQRRTMTWEKFKLLTRRYPLVYPSPGEIYTLW
jgi:group II intron reverse transcriptase/maturase